MSFCNFDCSNIKCLIVSLTLIGIILVVFCAKQVHNDKYGSEKKIIVEKFNDKNYNETMINQTSVDNFDKSETIKTEPQFLKLYYDTTSNRSKKFFQEKIAQLIDSGLLKYVYVNLNPIFPQVGKYNKATWSHYCKIDNECEFSKVHGCAVITMSLKIEEYVPIATKVLLQFLTCLTNSKPSWDMLNYDLMFQCRFKNDSDYYTRLVNCIEDDSRTYNIIDYNYDSFNDIKSSTPKSLPSIMFSEDEQITLNDNVNLVELICNNLHIRVPECSKYEHFKSSKMDYNN